MLNRGLERLLRLPRGKKRWLMVAADAVMLPLALWSGFMIRLAEPVPDIMLETWWLFPLVVLVGIPVFVRLGLYRAVVRFMGTRAIWAVGTGVVLLALVLWAAVALAQVESFPRSVPINFAIVAFMYVGGSRFLVRALYHSMLATDPGVEPVVIYGAGEAGVQLLSGLKSGGRFRVVAFLDDDRTLQGSSIDGIRVRHPSALDGLIKRYGLRRLLLAIPSASRADRRAILERLEGYPLYIQTVPSMDAVVSGQARLDELEDIDIADLLGRDPVPPDRELLKRSIEDRVVMVTGAGGSIGAELCRRILRLKPRLLVLYERNEFSLYRIERDLEVLADQKGLEVPVVALLGSVANPRRVRAVLKEYGVQTLYHAAAYKHVPIVEANLIEGVRNNVFGTAILADAAMEVGVERFILISTDKAVRPTNVMGATKRLAEMLLQDRARQNPPTIFSMVRFGNVLGSSGSVVPLFHQQIRDGGPVTVTHPEITRYFMSIPEAAELVIQAGAMAEGGEVFVLDMGEPVRIVDLATRMIRLHGRQVKEDGEPEDGIEIAFTGLRPGEKLFEELLIGDNVVGTSHSKIMRAHESCVDSGEVRYALDTLDQAEREMNTEIACQVLKRVVVEYEPIPAGHESQ
ncbi:MULTISPECIES: nucleoside-diphosphate sugar epimerase/dehydratase [unclassified Thioalkalivibrio]|uniref:polysaccharide biosynthesis protein n=1 Tax=unclassified Thioalkalivibrio TaxID=2621013 RepID=UPI0003694331|nr:MULTISPECIES: nucleoside-diphosphate sugar epimerase/dehydratase [unclassified Thioalkalivibrio]